MAQVQAPILFCRLFAFLPQQQKLMCPGLTVKFKISIKMHDKKKKKMTGECAFILKLPDDFHMRD